MSNLILGGYDQNDAADTRMGAYKTKTKTDDGIFWMEIMPDAIFWQVKLFQVEINDEEVDFVSKS